MLSLLLFLFLVLRVDSQPQVADGLLFLVYHVEKFHVDQLLLRMDQFELLGFFTGNGRIFLNKEVPFAVFQVDVVVVGRRVDNIQYPLFDGVLIQVKTAVPT